MTTHTKVFEAPPFPPGREAYRAGILPDIVRPMSSEAPGPFGRRAA